MEWATSALEWLLTIPGWLVYLIVGAAAAIENIFPPIPADVAVVIGGVIAGAGDTSAWILLAAVLVGNVGSALFVYWLGMRYGRRFFGGRLGQFLLAPRQLRGLERAYERFGFPIIFFSRFLPVFRPVVPAFAGISHLGLWKTAIPVAMASAIWYGALVYLGTTAGSNWEALLASLEDLSVWLWVAAAVVFIPIFWIWRKTRGSLEENLAGEE